jgi:hypothetical protein
MSDIVRQSELEMARNWLNESFLLPATGAGMSRLPVSFKQKEIPL